jgi:pSer/pThr/pTyr-binding forkhead associated (FHA) protein
MNDLGRINDEADRPTVKRDKLVEELSTSIDVFQRRESLAGFITDHAHLSDAEFLTQNPHPVLLTSMPDEISLAVWTVIMHVKKKTPQSANEATLLKRAKDLYYERITQPGRYYIGRAPECDVILAPRSISRRHAILENRDVKWVLTDLGSTNGTRLNGRPLSVNAGTVLGTAPSKIEFGADTLLWFVPAPAFLDYMKDLQKQVPETPPNGSELDDSMVVYPAVTPKDPIKLPPKSLDVTKTSIRIVDKSTSESTKISEAETNPLLRKEDLEVPGLANTWGDEDRLKLPPKTQAARSVSKLALAQEIEQEIEASPRLMAAIKALAAMDSLIQSVTAKLRNNPNPVTISSSEEGDKIPDIADQLVRLGPMLRGVWVKLSVSEAPVEIYSSVSSRLGRVSDVET